MERLGVMIAVSVAFLLPAAYLALNPNKLGRRIRCDMKAAVWAEPECVKAVLGSYEIVLLQNGKRVSIPVQNITGITCANHVHHRFGAAVLRLVPRLDLDKAESHHVGLSYTISDPTSGRTRNVELPISVGDGENRDFVAALEALTGKKAVDPNRTPTVVR